LVTLAVVARALSPTAVGRYVLVTAIGAFAYFACDVGLGQRLAREGAAHPRSREEQHAAALRRRVQLFAVVAGLDLVIWFFAALVLDRSLTFFACTVLGMTMPCFAYEFECLARAHGRMDVELISTGVGNTLTAGVTIVGLLCQATLLWIPVGLVCGGVVRTFIAYRLAPREEPRAFSVPATPLRLCLPYAATSLLQSAFVQVDVLVIGLVAGATTTGEYALVSRPLLAAGTMAAYAMNGVIPTTARTWVQTPALAVRQVIRNGALALVGGCATFGVAALAYRPILSLGYGEAVDNVSYGAVLIVSSYLVFTSFNAVVGAGFTGLGMQPKRALAVFCGLCVTVLLCLLLVPRYGVAGAVVQFSASEATVCAFLAVLLFRRMRALSGAQASSAAGIPHS
jgi:O-antigen/teichoic acid export membrane protein